MKYKTAFYSFYLPVAAAMYMVSVVGAAQEGPGPRLGLPRRKGFIPVLPCPPQAGINGKEEHENAKAILLEMGEFFQIQVGGGSAPLGACQVLAVALRCCHCHPGRLPGLLRGPCSDREGWHRHPGQQVQLAGGAVSAPGHGRAEAHPGGKGRDPTPGRGRAHLECRGLGWAGAEQSQQSSWPILTEQLQQHHGLGWALTQPGLFSGELRP